MKGGGGVGETGMKGSSYGSDLYEGSDDVRVRMM